MISNEMMFDLKMLCPRVFNMMFSKIYRICVITFYWDERVTKIKIVQVLLHP